MNLSAQDVVDWVGSREVQKAGPYLSRLSRLYLQGGALRGEAQGSDVHPYRVRVEPAQRGIGRAFCSCPVGSGGRCKHVAALLLKYLQDPGAFAPRATVEDTLAGWSQERLRHLIDQMLTLRPELEDLLDAPAAASTEGGANVGGLFAVIRRSYQPWEGDEEGPDTTLIWREVERADAWLLAPATARRALGVYEAVLAEIEECYDEWQTDSEFDDLLHHCLHTCLRFVQDGAWDDDQARQDALEIVRSAYASRLTSPYPDRFGPFARALSPRERADFAELFQAMLSGSDHFGNESLARAIMDLKAGQPLSLPERERLLLATRDDAAILDFYLAAGREADLRRYLAGDKRVRLSDLDPVFAKYGREELQEELVVEAQKKSPGWPDSPEREWLYRRFVDSGRRERAHVLARETAEKWGDARWYGRTRDTSTDWEKERPRVLRALHGKAHLTDRLLELLLTEGLLDEAGRLYDERGRAISGAAALHLAATLSASTQNTSRRKAAAIYAEVAERLIEGRGRESYREAARLLGRMKALVSDTSWDSHLTALLARHKALRSLREELGKAGLL